MIEIQEICLRKVNIFIRDDPEIGLVLTHYR